MDEIRTRSRFYACRHYLLVWFIDFGFTARQNYFEPSKSVGGAKTGDPLLV